MTELEKILMKRDNISYNDVQNLIADAVRDMENYDDPSDFMADWFGLEPDYFEDLLLYC